MEPNSDQPLFFALKRFENKQASSEDIAVIAEALSLGQIEITPIGDSKKILQSGGINYGESNDIHISGSIIGQQTISGVSGDQIKELIDKIDKINSDTSAKIKRQGIIIVVIIVAIVFLGAGIIWILINNELNERHAKETETKSAVMTLTAAKQTLDAPTITPSQTIGITPTSSQTSSRTQPTESQQAQNYFTNDCIQAYQWDLYQIDNVDAIAGCWPLASEWGFGVENGVLKIKILPDNQIKEYGIYTPLPEAGVVRLKVKLEQLTTSTTGVLSNLSIGIVPSRSVDIDSGFHLFFQSESTDPYYPIFIKKNETGTEEEYLQEYGLGTEKEVEFSIDEFQEVIVKIDGEVVVDKQKADSENNVFLIRIRIPKDAELEAYIQDFIVEPDTAIGAEAQVSPIPVNPSNTEILQGIVVFEAKQNGNREIFSLDLGQPEATPVNITDNASNDTSPEWSPDGKKIVFVSDRDESKDIFVMNPDGTGVQNLTNDSVPDDEPTWSPDGSKIAFVSMLNRSSIGEEYVFVINSEGFENKRLSYSNTNTRSPSWSVDGERIFFLSAKNDPNPRTCTDCDYEILVVDLDENTFDEDYVTEKESVRVGLSHHPIETMMAYVSWQLGSNDIFTIFDDGTNITELISWSTDEEAPSWSPDGKKLIFVSEDNGVRTLFVANSDGSEPKAIISMDGLDNPSWRP